MTDVECEDIGPPPENLFEQRNEVVLRIMQPVGELVIMLDLGRITEMCIVGQEQVKLKV